MVIRRDAVLNLYKHLIRESKKWQSYNYRMYTLRKIRDEFQRNKILKDTESIEKSYNEGLENLAMIKRQVTVGNLYSTRPLVIENVKKNSSSSGKNVE